MVSLVAWFSLLPMIVAGLYGGAIADRFDRRAVALSASTVAWASTVVLATIAWLGADRLDVLRHHHRQRGRRDHRLGDAPGDHAAPAAPEQLPKAAALLGISAGIMVTVGPGIAGVLVARAGYAWTYTVDVVLFFAGFFGLWTLPRIRPEGEHADQPAGSVRSSTGSRHLRRAPNVRMSFVVDIIAMTFGQPMVLFPAVGAIVIGGGSVTAGILLASFAVGGILSSLGSGRRDRAALAGPGDPQRDRLLRPRHPRLRGRAGRRPSSAATPCSRWTSATSTGGPSRLAALCLAVAGGSDNISAIFRQSILQAAVPDHLRGRTQGVFTVVVTGGPRLGQMFAGTLATLTATWVPSVVGGVLVVVLVVVTVARVPSFRDYDALDPRP